MKKIVLFFAAVLAAINVNAFGGEEMYDFESGGLYYKILSEWDATVKVTYKSMFFSANTGEHYNEGWNIEEAIIPSSVTNGNTTYSVTQIGDNAFHGCSLLRKVTLPNSITNVEWGAFEECPLLTNPIYSDYLFAYMPPSFSGAYTIPEGIKIIPRFAFAYNYEGLTGITIPNSVETIEDNAFGSCGDLISFTVKPGNQNYSSEDGILFNKDKTTLIMCPRAKTGDYIVPGSVKNFGERAFELCCGIRNLTIPNTVENIDGCAFTLVANIIYDGEIGGCGSVGYRCLNGFVDGDFVYRDASKTVLAACFQTATGKIVLPSTVQMIGLGAFYGCLNMTSIEIPSSVSSIGQSAFAGCTGLNAVYISDLAKWCSLDLADWSVNPLYYAHDLYVNNVKQTNLAIPDGVTCIKNSAFANSSITSVTIPNSVTEIEGYAFGDCSALSSVILGENVKEIGYSSFGGCSNLKAIYCCRFRPANVEYDTFEEVDVNTCVLYVPEGAETIYMSTDVWRDFENILTWTPSMGVEDVSSKDTQIKLLINGQVLILRGDKTYTLQGQEVK